jgi:hypothetical protein
MYSRSTSGDQKMIEAFAAQGADPAFRNGVRARCADRGADDADVGAGEYRVEGGGELAVLVASPRVRPCSEGWLLAFAQLRS